MFQIEYMIIKLDHKNRKARLSLRGSELLEVLREAEETNPKLVLLLWVVIHFIKSCSFNWCYCEL